MSVSHVDHGGGLDLLEVAERLLGAAAKDRLWARYSGCEFYVPSQPPYNHPLVKLVGLRGASILAGEVGNVRFTLPKYPDFGAMGRREFVLVRTLAGATLNEIALEGGITQRHVSFIRAQLRENGELPSRARLAQLRKT